MYEARFAYTVVKETTTTKYNSNNEKTVGMENHTDKHTQTHTRRHAHTHKHTYTHTHTVYAKQALEKIIM